MPILKFLWLAIRPISKAEATYGWWELMNILPPIAYYLVPKFTEWTKNIDFIWFAGIPALLFLIAGIKSQFKLDSYKKKLPKLQYRLLSFPLGGYRIVRPTENFPFEPQTGYAKIVIRNTGGLLEDCIGTVTGISKVNITGSDIKLMPLVFTSSNLFWDNGEISRSIPNDGVDRYLNLAYLDQNKPDAWQLAIDESKREDYFTGRHKIDVVISSLKTQLEPLKVEIALGYGGRETPPAPLNLQSWDKWYQSVQKKSQQAPDKEGSQT